MASSTGTGPRQSPGQTRAQPRGDSESRRAAEPTYRIGLLPGAGRRGLSCWLALPDRIAPGAASLVAVHGSHRRAEAQVRAFAPRAAAQGRVVIAPLFDREEWPHYQQVVLGGRADLALLDLLQDMRLAGFVRTRRISLAGYAAGAGFAHRFAMLYPHLVRHLTVTAADWYTFPNDTPFPYGLGVGKAREDWSSQMADGLDAFLSVAIDVCVGTADNLPGETTRRGLLLNERQGPDRVARATRWVAALNAAAIDRGLTPRVRLGLLPGCGHDFGQCIARAGLARIVLPDRSSGIGASA